MNRFKRACVFFLGLIAAASFANAQSAGTVEGTVTDSSHAVIANATVVARNAATGVETTRTTNGAGLFVLVLPPGDYRVEATATGFQPELHEKITVDALADVPLNFQLNVGAATSAVTVSATVGGVQTEDATLGQTTRNELYDALPLAMNLGVPRDPTAFVGLAPGVAAVVLQSAGPSYTSFNGAQQATNGLFLEGLSVTLPNVQGDTRDLALGVSVEAVDQFQVEINGEKAQYQGQGFHNYVLKSGTDQIHGGAYEFFRNTDLDARGFFSPFVPLDRQNEFGGNVGGPIKKDKIFFFGNYSGYYFNTATAPTILSVPSLAERNGDFSALPAAIYDPASQTCSGAVCSETQFPSNIIPTNRLSKAASSFQSYLPDPTGAGFVNNYLQPLPRSIHNNNTTMKFDANINEKHRLYGVFVYGQWLTDYTGNLTPTGTALPLPYTATPGIVEERPWITQLHETYLISPTLLNNFAVGMTRLSIPIFPVTAAGNYPEKADLTGLPPSGQAATGFPGITFSGNNIPNSWSGSGPFSEWQNNYALQDSLQWVHGNHILNFGGAYQIEQDNLANPTSGTDATFTFANNQTAGFSPTGTLLTTTGNGYASYLLGAVSSASVVNNNVVETGTRYSNYSLFVQDDWKASRKLTLNLGLRWDLYLPYSEDFNRFSYMVPSLPNPAAVGANGALAYGGSPIDTHWKNFQPRLGLAYALDSKTVFRAGFVLADTLGAGGIGGNGNTGPGRTGYNPPSAIASAVTGEPAFYWDQGVPPIVTPYPLLTPGFGVGDTTINPTGAVSVDYVNPTLSGRAPYYINWSGGLQRQLPGSFVLGVTYSASVGHFLPRDGDLGIWTDSMPVQYLALGSLLTAQATPANLAAAKVLFPQIALPFSNFQGTIATMLKPFPQYAGITCYSCDLGNSTYNSLQVTLQRRLSKGFTTQLAYTLSKEIDNIPNGGQLGVVGGTRDPYDGLYDRGLGAIDHRHNLHLTMVYRLPFGKGYLGGGNPVLSRIIGGWSISNIFTFTTGAPLGITGSGCNTPGIVSTCIPSYNPSFTGSVMNAPWGSGNVLGSGAASYISKNAFVDPAPYTFGNAALAAPYGLTAPTLWDIDITLRREISIRERMKLQLSADFFNVLNNVIFAAPGTNIDSANFGQLTTAANSPRRIQFGARFIF